MTMPSQTTPRPLTVTVLAALWVSLGRCGVSRSPGPGCDNGKLSLDRDLPADAVYRDCPGSTWSTQRLPSIDTVYDPVPAEQLCMETSISYNHVIPSSGAYRPVRAERGEYLYCPPQRWLNNLHHGATVLLYHPCAPLHERLLLSVLARSCLPDHIVTSHPQLSEHMPIALVSWGHTLELSTVASSDVCDWLETTVSTRTKFGGASQTRKYNLLLTRSAEQQRAHPEEHSAKMKESLRRCCERTISPPDGAMESKKKKKESLTQTKEEGKRRQIRAAIKQKNVKDESAITHQTTGGVQTCTFGPSAGNLSGPCKSQNPNQGLTPRPTTPLGSNVSETTLRSDSSGFKARVALQRAAQQPGPKHPSAGLEVLTDGVNRDHNDTARPGAPALSSKDEGTAKRRDENVSEERNADKDATADGSITDKEVVDVRERELEHEKTHSDSHFHHKSDSKSQPGSPPSPQQHQNPQPASYLPSSHDCDGCKAGERCECNEDSGASAAVVNSGLPRTPRTDEAVWAAAALGFLLILLTLSVLHTRLYRNWRTMPSLYWHDPQRDYDSVADVIRRRLRIANRRRKRGRRQECVLLPSSSSSDEHP